MTVIYTAQKPAAHMSRRFIMLLGEAYCFLAFCALMASVSIGVTLNRSPQIP